MSPNDLQSLLALENSHKISSIEEKLKIYNEIVELFLKSNDHISAEIYLNRAGLLIPECKDQKLIIDFRISQGKILDKNFKFLEASQKFTDLSFFLPPNNSNLSFVVKQAIVCAVLASPGPSRNRLLKSLDIHSGFDSSFLQRVFLDKILKKDDLLTSFAKHYLSPHHKVPLNIPGYPNNKSIWEHSIIEHNLYAVSKLYINISLSELAELLGISVVDTEAYASRMITEERMSGEIDQNDQILYFDNLSVKTDIKYRWEERITNICNLLDKVVK